MADKPTDELREYLRKLGRKGGQASAAALTPAERKEKGRKAILTRWARAKAPKPLQD